MFFLFAFNYKERQVNIYSDYLIAVGPTHANQSFHKHLDHLMSVFCRMIDSVTIAQLRDAVYTYANYFHIDLQLSLKYTVYFVKLGE